MRLSARLRNEKTQAPVRGSQTFNASGLYYPPYGKTVFKLTGKGEDGHAAVPAQPSTANYTVVEGYDPGTPPTETVNTSYCIQYVTVNAMHETYNSTSGGGTLVATNYTPQHTDVLATVAMTSPVITYNNANATRVVSDADYPSLPISPYTIISYSPDGLTKSTAVHNYSYTDGNGVIPSPTFGNVYYTGGTPASTYYYTAVAGYNPAVPAQDAAAGASVTNHGVTFPGGASGGGAAPLISDAIAVIPYSGTGIPITVAPGGYVTVQNY